MFLRHNRNGRNKLREGIHLKKLFAILLTLAMVIGMTSSVAMAAGGTLYVCVGSQPETIDPAMNSAVDGSNYLHHLFEGLYRHAWDGSGIELGAAESVEISEDGLTWTFTIREDAKWSDGQALVAGDFEYAWKRLVDPATAAPYAGDMGGFILNGLAIVEEEMEPDTLGVKALDDRTLEVKLQNPCAFFDEVMAFPTFYPVRKDTVEANGDAWAIRPETYLCTGPFILQSWTADEEIVMVPNPYYYDVAKLVPEKIVWKLMNDPVAELAAVRAGEIAFGQSFPSEEIEAMKAEGIYRKTANVGTYYINMNNAKAPFDDVLVRKAFALAVDPIYIAEVVMLGSVIPATNFVGPGFVDADGSDFVDFQTVIDRSDYEANKEAAKAALAEAGYPNGEGFPILEYVTNPAGSHVTIAEALAYMWKDVLNVDVTVATQEWNVFLAIRRDGDYILARNGWIADVSDPSNLLNLFTSYSGNNSSFYKAEEFDALMNIANTSMDPAVRMAAMHEAEQMAIGEAYAAIPLYYYAEQLAVNTKLRGYALYPTNERLFMLAYMED